ncbi:nickel-type superoxide dismutase maturation protease [Pseudenhygromyxa sp. WMMC2535]|uniref:nickel-type superoxide dismutase maturation protease n=1 Tax=Pseudenhygromyxa sp. WMMC2535 TaxID=2712867 RepID=UPI0031F78103
MSPESVEPPSHLLVAVSGSSMAPALLSGDQIVIDTRAKPQVGDIVVARHPYRTNVHVIKRLVSFDERGRARLEGDNPSESTDSRTLGLFEPALILGPMVEHLPASGGER